MRDGRASGTAFIVFASADGVAKAVELNEATFGAFEHSGFFCLCLVVFFMRACVRCFGGMDG